MIQVTDQLGRVITLERTPKRIISLVPSQTELLIHLGLEEQLIGITKFCVHPKHLLKTKTSVGGTKQVHFDRIRALNPDIILCNKEENTQAIVEETQAIAPVHVSDVKTLPHAFTLIQQYGILFDKPKIASELVNQLLFAQQQFQKEITKQSIKKVAYFIWREPWMVVGKDTFINSLLALNKLDNVYNDTPDRYPEVQLDTLRNLDYVLLSSEPFPFTEKHIAEIKKHTTAQVILVDGEYFSWYGSRLLDAFDYFKNLQQLLET